MLANKIIRVLVTVDGDVLVSVISKLFSAIRYLWFPSSSTITQEIMGRGNPSTEQLNTAASRANTVRSIGGVMMLGRAGEKKMAHLIII